MYIYIYMYILLRRLWWRLVTFQNEYVTGMATLLICDTRAVRKLLINDNP